MQALLREGLEAGAFGYSTGLEYPAESEAPEDEIVALCRTAAAAGGYYATHTRKRDGGSRRGGGRGAAHRRAGGDPAPDLASLAAQRPRGLRPLRRAGRSGPRRRGQDVAFDMHTRLFGLTYLHAMLPAWATQGGPEQLAAHLRDPAARARIGAHQSIITAGGGSGSSCSTTTCGPRTPGRASPRSAGAEGRARPMPPSTSCSPQSAPGARRW